MFTSQHWQIKLVYAGFGGFLMLIGMLLSPVTAQRDKYGHIVCTSLTVVDALGEEKVFLNDNVHGGFVGVIGDDGKSTAGLTIDERGGLIVTTDSDANTGVVIGVGEHGGRVGVSGKIGGSVVAIDINEHGGLIKAFGQDGKSSATLGISSYGGYAITTDKLGEKKLLD